MFVIIKDNIKIIKYNLISNINYKGIKIYKRNNIFYIGLSNNLYFSDNSKVNKLECKKYSIYQENIYYDLDVYIYENDDKINDFKIYKKDNFIIAFDERANVICNDPYLKQNYLGIKDNKIVTNFNICVNGNKYNGFELSDGDVIEYLGLKIIYYHDFIYMNNFYCDNRLQILDVKANVINYNNENVKVNNYIKKDKDEFLLEEVKEFKTIKQKDKTDFIKNIIPGLIMSFSMAYMAILNYHSNPNNSLVTYIIMPISMFITSVLLPLIFNIIDNNKIKHKIQNDIDNYLLYLNEYEKDIEVKIENYLKQENECFFDYDIDKVFYLKRKDEEFCCLSLGYINEHKQLKFKYSDVEIIDNKLNKIKNRLNNIENYPLYLDIKENKIITIVANNNLLNKLFRQYLLEICFKHHYDDLKVAVYSLNPNLIDEIYNLPHLYFNSIRLTLNNESQLMMLDQLKLEVDLLLFVFTKIDFKFSNPHIHVLYFTSDINDVYKDSDSIVEFYSSGANLYSDKKISFKYIEYDVNFNRYFKYLSSIVNRNNKNKKYSFLDIFDKDIIDYYRNEDRYLCATFAYNNTDIVSIDLHESKLGPHGLIGGSTGSGKSELIVSFLLSLCIRYSPNYLNIVLIDYKGSGLKKSLSYESKLIPHVIASVSNLDNNVLQRLIIALNNECKKRQNLFKELSNLANISIMNIDDYLDNNTFNLDNMAHLLIVVDEFAELKKEHPEQIKELISLSRIGRSLGIHLILATQKPSGVIDDEIWSNSHFKIALKVFEEKDSMDLIKSKDAAYLNSVGSFLLQVDDSLIKAKSIYAKNDIENNEPYKVSLLDNTLNVTKSTSLKIENSKSVASYFCEKIFDACEKLNINSKMLQFKVHDSKLRYEFNINNKFIFGESDDYLNNIYEPISYELNTNILVFSTRKDEINAIINTLNENKINSVVISNKIYSDEYISDSLLYEDSSDINYLFDYILDNNNLNISIVIEDISCLLSYDDNYIDYLCKILRRSLNLKVNIIALTHNSLINIKLLNCFEKLLMINIYDLNDISNFYGSRSEYISNCFYYDKCPISFVPIKLEELHYKDKLIDSIILRIPEEIKPEINNNKYLLGYDLKTKQKIYGDNNVLVVSSVLELLDIYNNAYPKLKTEEYNYKSSLKTTKKILWLGPNIFSQRLFFVNLKKDLEYDEAYYIDGSKKYLLRSINNV